jgi:hypothetical protein
MSPDIKELIGLIQSQLNSQEMLLWAQLIILVLYTGATFFLAFIGWKQLKKIEDATNARSKNEMKWATIRACERLDTDSTFDGFNQRIFSQSRLGKKGNLDYTCNNMKSLDVDIKGLLNCFDALAIGVLEGVYNEDIIRDHYETTIQEAVKIFLLCESVMRDGTKVLVDRPVVNIDEYKCLMRLYAKWQAEVRTTKTHFCEDVGQAKP